MRISIDEFELFFPGVSPDRRLASSAVGLSRTMEDKCEAVGAERCQILASRLLKNGTLLSRRD
jgi:hypothetical protein